MTKKTEQGLSPRQQDFVREYVIDKNATQAAIRAGYSPRTAQEQSSRLLSNVMVWKAVQKLLDELAIKTETDAEWVRRRLREEAEDFSEFSSQSARVRAIEIVARLNGLFEKDNRQKAGDVIEALRALVLADGGSVLKPDASASDPDDD